jgi:hypothetical protein
MIGDEGSVSLYCSTRQPRLTSADEQWSSLAVHKSSADLPVEIAAWGSAIAKISDIAIPDALRALSSRMRTRQLYLKFI